MKTKKSSRSGVWATAHIDSTPLDVILVAGSKVFRQPRLTITITGGRLQHVQPDVLPASPASPVFVEAKR